MSVEFIWKSEEFKYLLRSCETDSVTPYILKYLNKSGTILEAGCGLARFVKFLSCRGYDIVGIELNENTVRMVKQLAPELDVRQGDVLSLDFGNDLFSGILSLGVVEHFVEGPTKPLMEMYRILKPGHYAVITVPSLNYIRRIRYAFGIYGINPTRILRRSSVVRRFFSKAPFMPSSMPYRWRIKRSTTSFFEYLFSKSEFEKELKRVGFTIIESAPVALIDGIYHEFGESLVKFRRWSFYPTLMGRLLNIVLSKIPFCHNHMHLCVVRK